MNKRKSWWWNCIPLRKKASSPIIRTRLYFDSRKTRMNPLLSWMMWALHNKRYEYTFEKNSFALIVIVVFVLFSMMITTFLFCPDLIPIFLHACTSVVVYLPRIDFKKRVCGKKKWFHFLCDDSDFFPVAKPSPFLNHSLKTTTFYLNAGRCKL